MFVKTLSKLLVCFLVFSPKVEGKSLSKSIQKIRYKYKITPKQYDLRVNDPIDVIIPCTFKDLPTLKYCIQGIRKNCDKIRRIIVLSADPMPVDAEWFDENRFPFSKFDLAYEIFQDEGKAKAFINNKNSRIGWIFQQFLKLYATYVISDLSTNILVLDADVLFINPVNFMDKNGNPLFAIGREYYRGYFEHMAKALPYLCRIHPLYSGIVHHMLFQKDVLDHLFFQVETFHQLPLWKAFCRSINHKEAEFSCLSEYEIYFNFCLLTTNQPRIRSLRWENMENFDLFKSYADKLHPLSNNTFVTYHSYKRCKTNALNN